MKNIYLLVCGYLNVNACDKTGDACAIVSRVNNYDEMLTKPIQAVSKAAVN
ncbi:DUF1805 domain-containing protein [Paraglaciecola sp.]|uniref:DUF1805 domain-containing protein n=1 Tax=Paraglaciecola sp. TaxID=1920173 RepID=UPI0030F44DC6